MRVAVVLNRKTALPKEVTFETIARGKLTRCRGDTYADVHFRSRQPEPAKRARKRKETCQNRLSGRSGVGQNKTKGAQSGFAPSSASHFPKICRYSFRSRSGTTRKKSLLDETAPPWTARHGRFEETRECVVLGKARVSSTELEPEKDQLFEGYLPRRLEKTKLGRRHVQPATKTAKRTAGQRRRKSMPPP